MPPRKVFGNGRNDMSFFKLGLNRVQEVLVMGLIIILAFTVWSNIELLYKISIGAIVFVLILLTSMASQILKQAEETNRQ